MLSSFTSPIAKAALVLTQLTALTSLVRSVDARIIGIAVPDVIKPGEGFNARIMTENYIQSVQDISIAFGAAPVGPEGILGTVLGSYYLGPEQSNVLYNITKWVPVPASLPKGPAVLAASLQSLWGAGSYPALSFYDVDVTIGDYTSTNYVSSLSQQQPQPQPLAAQPPASTTLLTAAAVQTPSAEAPQ